MTVDLKQQARKWRQEHWNEFDVAHPTSMLAAFAEHVLSQQSATPQGISDEGGLGDAAQSSGPRSAGVPSETDSPSGSPPIAIAPAHGPWISVDNRYPDLGVDVLVTDGREVFFASRQQSSPLDQELWYTSYESDDMDPITHWMPLPSPPAPRATGPENAAGGSSAGQPSEASSQARDGVITGAPKTASGEARIAELENFIRKHHPHAPQCASQYGDPDEPCTCGRDAILSPPK